MSTFEGPHELASYLAEEYLNRTRAHEPWQEGKCVPRYLWTDAFALCLLLGLDWKGIAFDGEEKTSKGSARDLVRSVHGILGRRRMDEKGSFVEASAVLESTGWLSDDRNRPTARGLRIGKRFPERKLHEEYDEDLEWDRDGQYFHYLTKWAHALSQLSAATTDSKYVLQAADLVKGIHWDFARGEPGARHLAWKMSTDLSRALVPTQGHADPLDGFVTYLHIQATLTYFGLETKHSLEGEIEDVYTMVIGRRFDTNDFLGIGCLLSDAAKLMQLCVRRIGTREKEVEARIPKLLMSVLEDADHGLERLKAESFLLPAEQRLAFREFGLSIGLQAVPLMLRVLSHIEESSRKSTIGDHDLRRIHSMLSHMLKSHYWMVDSIHVFWKETKHRRCRSWTSHRDINEVMWATSLVPDGYLEMLF